MHSYVPRRGKHSHCIKWVVKGCLTSVQKFIKYVSVTFWPGCDKTSLGRRYRSWTTEGAHTAITTIWRVQVSVDASCIHRQIITAHVWVRRPSGVTGSDVAARRLTIIITYEWCQIVGSECCHILACFLVSKYSEWCLNIIFYINAP